MSVGLDECVSVVHSVAMMNATRNKATETKTLTPAIVSERVSARRDGRLPCPYPVILVFVREHTSGFLAGIRGVDTLPFCAATDAAEWVAKINAKEARGAMNYKVTEYVIDGGTELPF